MKTHEIIKRALAKLGGAGSGHHGHKGIPGHRGGSAPKGGGGGFNETAERDIVMITSGASGQPRDGITREQMKRFFARRDAAATASRVRYQNSKSTVKETIDEAIRSGMRKVSISGRWTVLSNQEGTDALRFGSKIDRDYIDVVLNRGSMAKNY